jgi:hypothetical protein
VSERLQEPAGGVDSPDSQASPATSADLIGSGSAGTQRAPGRRPALDQARGVRYLRDIASIVITLVTIDIGNISIGGAPSGPSPARRSSETAVHIGASRHSLHRASSFDDVVIRGRRRTTGHFCRQTDHRRYSVVDAGEIPRDLAIVTSLTGG